MVINEVYNFLVYIIRKERNGFLTIEDFNRDIDRAQLEVFEDYYEMYGQTQKTHDAISNFKATYTFTKTDCPLGVVTFPDNYQHLRVVQTVTYNNTTETASLNPVRIVADDELTYALKSQVRPVSVSNPIGLEQANSIQLYPKVAQAGEMLYFKRPIAPVYAYTLSGTDGRTVTYDSANSVQLEWLDVYINKIVAKTLTYVGINLNEPQLVQYAEMKNKEAE